MKYRAARESRLVEGAAPPFRIVPCASTLSADEERV